MSLIIGRLFSRSGTIWGCTRAGVHLPRARAVRCASSASRFWDARRRRSAMLGEDGWSASCRPVRAHSFALDANPFAVGGLTLGLAAVFLAAAYVSSRKVKRVDVRELVAE
ncbi:MAG: hypothetical protein ACLSVD_05640 [Eggerthellaceae bacterium]